MLVLFYISLYLQTERFSSLIRRYDHPVVASDADDAGVVVVYVGVAIGIPLNREANSQAIITFSSYRRIGKCCTTLSILTF